MYLFSTRQDGNKRDDIIQKKYLDYKNGQGHAKDNNKQIYVHEDKFVQLSSAKENFFKDIKMMEAEAQVNIIGFTHLQKQNTSLAVLGSRVFLEGTGAEGW